MPWRIESPRQIMEHLGLVPGELLTGETVRRGITKAGNGRIQYILVESAWAYRQPPRVRAYGAFRPAPGPKQRLLPSAEVFRSPDCRDRGRRSAVADPHRDAPRLKLNRRAARRFVCGFGAFVSKGSDATTTAGTKLGGVSPSARLRTAHRQVNSWRPRRTSPSRSFRDSLLR